MLQSIAMCDYDSSTYDGFGISFYDEVHCVPSKIFSKALRKINTRYHFGLSATPNRADGMSAVTKLYIGPIVYQINKKTAKKNPKKLQVFTVAFDKLPSGNLYRSLSNYQGKPDVVKMISNITKCPKRLALISMILRFFIIKDKRNILVLSDRIQYLRDIEEQINKDLSKDVPFKIRYYIGGMKEKERKDSESADLLLASYSMAKEAMDIPILDTVLMVTSKSNIEQSIGRIQRKIEYPDEKPPLVIDLVDNFSSFQSQSIKRNVFYRKNNYPVTNFIFEDINSSQIYSDFEEGIKDFLRYSEISDNLVIEECKDIESLSQKKTTKKKPVIIQTKIDSSLYNMIGDCNFDI
jgi:superfamily II DNA or RNA helicase